jgi:peptide/nickel transport system permease protein
MTGFIIRRLGQAIVVIIGVTLITFGLLHALPGSLARDILGPRAPKSALQAFTVQNGLNKPFYTQYWLFIKQLVTGKLVSYQLSRSVNSVLGSDLPRDLILGGVSLILSVVIAVPIGIAQAVRRNGHHDQLHSVVDASVRARVPADPVPVDQLPRVAG